MQEDILVFVLNDRKREILLSKQKFGANSYMWSGYRGDAGHAGGQRDAAAHALETKCGIKADPGDLKLAAVMNTAFGRPAAPDQPPKKVLVFVLRKWSGHPRPTDEAAKPTWYPLKRMPLHEMLPAEKQLLHHVLGGRQGVAFVEFDGDERHVGKFDWFAADLEGEH